MTGRAMTRGQIRWRLCLFVSAVVCISTVYVPQAGRAQNPDVKPNVGFGIAMTGPGGLYAYVPNRWGLLHVNATNRLDQPLEIISATYFNDEPTLQYGRKIWLPPRSRIHAWHPIRIPDKISGDGKKLNFHSLVMDANAGQDVLIRTESGQMQHDGFLPVNHEELVTGVIDDIDGDTHPEAREAVDLIGICRVSQSVSRSVSSLTDSIFASGQEGFDALDELVICDARPTRDVAGMAAIRRWLFSGGHLWVMLDQTDPLFLEMLLGDEIQCEIVDRVTLNNVRLDSGSAAPSGAYGEQEFERPVELVRTVVSDVDIAFSVNGWPAAFWKNCGEGRLLVTTLGPRGWTFQRNTAVKEEPRRLRRRPADGTAGQQAQPATEPATVESGPRIPNDAMANLSMEFWSERKAASLAPQVIEPLVQEYVGYGIPSRYLVGGLLAGFCLLLVLTGIGLWRIRKLEWLGAAGPVLALLVSGVLIGLGQARRQAVPPTAASLQYIQAVHGSDDFIASGQVAIYTPEPGAATLNIHSSGSIVPEMAGLETTTRRLIWTDLDESAWLNLPSTAGSRNATFNVSGELKNRVAAQAMFGPEGLTGKLSTSQLAQASDALIATAQGRMGVRLQPDGTFQSNVSDVFSHEQYLGADLLTDEQNRRQRILQTLLSNSERRAEFSRPVLLFWTEPWDLGFQFAEGARNLGATLVSVPLDLKRPVTGTSLVIVPPLLPFKPARGPDGLVPSGLWDQLHQEWAEKSAPSATWVRYQIPKALLPLKIDGARLVARVRGPIGKLEISGFRDGKPAQLKQWIDPVGTVEVAIPSGDALSVDADGGLMLRISGGDAARPELTRTETADGPKVNYWRIESIDLELKATTVDLPE